VVRDQDKLDVTVDSEADMMRLRSEDRQQPKHRFHQPHCTKALFRAVTASLVLGLATFSVAVLPAQVASAATQTVTNCNDSGGGSLREAVLSASSGETINFALTPSCSTVDLTSGEIAIDTSMTIEGPGSNFLAMSGGNVSRVFDIEGGTVAISGLTIEDGNGVGANDDGYGGAIENEGNLSIINSTLADNSTTGNGGAIYSKVGALAIIGSALVGNSADSGDGGAIDNFAAVMTITKSTLSGNSASSAGAISNENKTIVVSSTLSGNSSNDGGAIASSNKMTITNSTLANNVAKSDGAGMENQGVATINKSTVSNNETEDAGGGLFNEGTLSVTNSTLSDNSAASGGGGIFNEGKAAFADTTVSGNSSTTDGGGGIFTEGKPVKARTTIVANSSGGDCSGSITDMGYNIDDDGSCGFNAPSISDSTTLDSTLGPLAENGGPTETVALLPGSPAIGVVPAADCPPTDQRGVTRPTPCDIGAYQIGGSTAPTPTIAKVRPAKGKPGKKVTITGSRLSGATAVSFDGTAASITTDAATKITTKVPAGAKTGTISVTTPGGTVTSATVFKVT
jgi:fibronectin-binding autotransporter adhesin